MWNRTWFPNATPLRCAWVALLLFAACAKEQQPSTDTTIPSVTAAPPVSPPGGGADSSCPESGAWRPCSVLERLEDAGLVVKQEPNPVQLPFMSVRGILYTTSRANVHVFLYRDESERRRDTEKLDSIAVAPRNGTYSWRDAAVLVTSNNLAAIVVSPNERQAERIILALSGGMPR
ncbi:MAG: hypothetical protein ACT4P6_08745 [Gemmatimonadaceae bacterium]